MFNDERSFFLNYFFNIPTSPSWCFPHLSVPTPRHLLSRQTDRHLLLIQVGSCSYGETARLQGLNERAVQNGLISFKSTPQNMWAWENREERESLLSILCFWLLSLHTYLYFYMNTIFVLSSNNLPIHLKSVLQVVPKCYK